MKRELVDSVMDEVRFLFAPSPAVWSHAGSEGTSTSQSGAPISAPYSGGGQANAGRKRGAAEEETAQNRENGRGNGGDPNKRPKLDGTQKDRQTITKFACPFYKRNPEKYKNQRACSGPGWETVHRVK